MPIARVQKRKFTAPGMFVVSEWCSSSGPCCCTVGTSDSDDSDLHETPPVIDCAGTVGPITLPETMQLVVSGLNPTCDCLQQFVPNAFSPIVICTGGDSYSYYDPFISTFGNGSYRLKWDRRFNSYILAASQKVGPGSISPNPYVPGDPYLATSGEALLIYNPTNEALPFPLPPLPTGNVSALMELTKCAYKPDVCGVVGTPTDMASWPKKYQQDLYACAPPLDSGHAVRYAVGRQAVLNPMSAHCTAVVGGPSPFALADFELRLFNYIVRYDTIKAQQVTTNPGPPPVVVLCDITSAPHVYTARAICLDFSTSFPWYILNTSPLHLSSGFMELVA